jgi:hypothetical protein
VVSEDFVLKTRHSFQVVIMSLRDWSGVWIHRSYVLRKSVYVRRIVISAKTTTNQ